MRFAAPIALAGVLASACATTPREVIAPIRPAPGVGELERREQTLEVPGQYETRTRSMPVTKTRTDYVQRCRYEPRMVMRQETQYEYQCRSVSVPETTYEYQYDYATHMSRSVPVTRYISKQDCGSQPVSRSVSRYESQYVCSGQTEMRMVTEYETKYEQVWVPPHQRLVTTFQKTAVFIASEPELVAAPRFATP